LGILDRSYTRRENKVMGRTSHITTLSSSRPYDTSRGIYIKSERSIRRGFCVYNQESMSYLRFRIFLREEPVRLTLHLLVDEHVSFRSLDVGVRNALDVVVGAEKPPGAVDLGGAGGRAFPEGDEVASRVVHAQVRDYRHQVVNVVPGGEVSILGVAQDGRSGNAAPWKR